MSEVRYGLWRGDRQGLAQIYEIVGEEGGKYAIATRSGWVAYIDKRSILAVVATREEAGARIKAATKAFREHQPAVNEAQAALTVARRVQKTAFVAALRGEGG